jgi:hypothetical protein
VSSPVSLLPQLPGAGLAPPNPQGLSDDEQRLISGLSTKLTFLSTPTLVRNAYYEGRQRLANLGVSVPDQLAGVRTVVDWPRICVDPLVARQVLDGFRVAGATDVDAEIGEHWFANGMDSEAQLCFLDSLVTGRGYMIVGSPDNPGESPIITTESPLNLAMTWDPRTRLNTAAYQAFEAEGVYVAVLYLPDQTIRMSRDETGAWVVDDRDQHNFGVLPVIRFPNRMRSHDREGQSEITPAVMNTTDSCVRSLLGMEIAREFYSIPHRYILGASEADFVGPDGTPKTALQMSMNKFLAFERDENGNAPAVGQFQAFDPSVFTKIVDTHAKLMASFTQFPPDYFGLVSTANPASADAIRVAYDGMNRRGKQVQNQNTGPLRQLAALIWRFANNGAPLPVEMQKVHPEWVDVETFTPGAMSDAMFKQAQMGAIPATSDVVLKKLGWSAADRAQLEIDRQVDAGASVLAELANSLQAKEARVDSSVIRGINPAAAAPVPVAQVPVGPTGPVIAPKP